VIQDFGALRLAHGPVVHDRAGADSSGLETSLPVPAMARAFPCPVWSVQVRGFPTLFAPGLAGFLTRIAQRVIFKERTGGPMAITVLAPPGPVILASAPSLEVAVVSHRRQLAP